MPRTWQVFDKRHLFCRAGVCRALSVLLPGLLAPLGSNRKGGTLPFWSYLPPDDLGVLWEGEVRAQVSSIIDSLKAFLSREALSGNLYPVWGRKGKSRTPCCILPQNPFKKYLQLGSQISKPSTDSFASASCVMQDTNDEPCGRAPCD